MNLSFLLLVPPFGKMVVNLIAHSSVVVFLGLSPFVGWTLGLLAMTVFTVVGASVLRNTLSTRRNARERAEGKLWAGDAENVARKTIICAILLPLLALAELVTLPLVCLVFFALCCLGIWHLVRMEG